MDSLDRKKIAVITKYAVDTFSHTDWVALGQITGSLKKITDHPRLLRSLGFDDDDYPFCVAEVVSAIFESDNSLIDEVVDHYDIDLWYQQKGTREVSASFYSSHSQICRLLEGWLSASIRKPSFIKSRAYVSFEVQLGSLGNLGFHSP